MNKRRISLAEELHSQGKAKELYELIKLDVEKEDPYAMYFSSTISLNEWHESEEEFDERRIRCLKKSVEGKVPAAAYQLACCYLYGEGVARDWEKGRYYARLASEYGHPHAGALLDQLEPKGD